MLNFPFSAWIKQYNHQNGTLHSPNSFSVSFSLILTGYTKCCGQISAGGQDSVRFVSIRATSLCFVKQMQEPTLFKPESNPTCRVRRSFDSGYLEHSKMSTFESEKKDQRKQKCEIPNDMISESRCPCFSTLLEGSGDAVQKTMFFVMHGSFYMKSP